MLKLKKNDCFRQEKKLNNKPIIAILPGSRTTEISTLLPIFSDVASKFQDFQCVVAKVPNIEPSFYLNLMQNPLPMVENCTYELLQNAEVAVVCSGTATLEAALIGTPLVVAYRSSWLSYAIAKRLIKVRFISLVNLILNKKTVEELIQSDCNSKKITAQINHLLLPETRTAIFEQYQTLRSKLTERNAAETTANYILDALRNKKVKDFRKSSRSECKSGSKIKVDSYI